MSVENLFLVNVIQLQGTYKNSYFLIDNTLKQPVSVPI